LGQDDFFATNRTLFGPTTIDIHGDSTGDQIMRKKLMRSRIFGGVCALALITVASVALLRPKPPRPPEHLTSAADLDAYLAALTAFGTPPGLSLVVVKDGRVVYERGFGLADRPKHVAATPDTVYGWWSMTKIFTAAAVFQLQEQGKLSIDDPVVKYLPFFKVTYPSAASRPIAIRNLLNHSSGIPNNVPALVGWIHHAGQPRLDQTKYVAQVLPDYAKLIFEPGDHGEYTNVGYMVLGAVIEAASGQTYEDYVRAHLLRPLGMGQTDFVYTDAMLPQAAAASHPWFSIESAMLPFMVDQWSSYVRETTDGRMWLNRFYANAAPPTGLIGPATDAARFAAAILNGGELDGQRILAPQTVRLMIADSHVLGRHGEADSYPGMSYGLGWHIVPEGLRLRIQHRGGGPGFGSEMRLYPDEGLAMVVIANDTTYGRDSILDLAATLDWAHAADVKETEQ
jgi:CubicO group peptidase (beta-lactamase class C family)